MNAAHAPTSIKELRPDQFRAFLLARGAEVLRTTNPYEVLRFRAQGDTHVIYRKDSGRLTVPEPALIAWRAFRTAGPWSGLDHRGQRINPRRKPVIIRTLIERDGPFCFFCGLTIDDGKETIEHLVPKAHGGPNHASNLALAHEACNGSAGHLSVMEKIKLRERMAGGNQ